MTTTQLEPGLQLTGSPSPEMRLSYARTVDRVLVHRESLGEVFLTDLQPVDENGYVAAAQLPRSHAYYGDHLVRPNTYDPVLLLEACRQAALAGAHEFFGVPSTNKFILTHLSVELTHPQWITVGMAPFPLAMHIRIANRKEREGRVTGLDYELDLSVNGVTIGQATVGLRFKTPTGYLTLRLNNRNGVALPSSATFPVQSPGIAVAPHLVGRANPDNVVLVDAMTEGDMGRARLRVPADHPSMFDHAQDHLPGMVLAEAARQLALLTVLDAHGVSSAKAFPTGLGVTFHRFGELEEDALLTATVAEQPTADDEPDVYYTQGGVIEREKSEASPAVDRLPVKVAVEQGGQSLCTFSFAMTRIQASLANRNA